MGERVWKPIESAPFRVVMWVRNSVMDAPVKATRGWVTPKGAVHEDTTFFTSVYTKGGFFHFSAGNLVCPTEWTEAKECELDDAFDVENADDLKKREG